MIGAITILILCHFLQGETEAISHVIQKSKTLAPFCAHAFLSVCQRLFYSVHYLFELGLVFAYKLFFFHAYHLKMSIRKALILLMNALDKINYCPCGNSPGGTDGVALDFNRCGSTKISCRIFRRYFPVIIMLTI